jgi:hypothetical protein
MPLVTAWQADHANIVIVTDLLSAVAVGFGSATAPSSSSLPRFPEEHRVGQRHRRLLGTREFLLPLVMGFVRDHTGSYALGFVILSMTAALCWALLLARSPQRSVVTEP